MINQAHTSLELQSLHFSGDSLRLMTITRLLTPVSGIVNTQKQRIICVESIEQCAGLYFVTHSKRPVYAQVYRNKNNIKGENIDL